MTELATFAMGCFWQPDELFRKIPGVIETEVGYTGGHTQNPTYWEVCEHGTGHAEAVRLSFDPALVSYAQLLEIFWAKHNPTTLNRQGPDVGEQYRSAIFFHSPEQEKLALETKAAVAASKRWGEKPIVTQVVAAGEWWKAEEDHQKYLMKRGIDVCH